VRGNQPVPQQNSADLRDRLKKIRNDARLEIFWPTPTLSWASKDRYLRHFLRAASLHTEIVLALHRLTPADLVA
jgi:hypothetical protein